MKTQYSISMHIDSQKSKILTYKFATGRPGLMAPATIFISWFVETPLPIRANSKVENGYIVDKNRDFVSERC